MSTVHLDRKDPTVDRIVKAAFPQYTGRDVQAQITPTCRFTGTMWDEGSRSSYVLIRIKDMALQHIPREQFMADSAGHHTDFPIPEGFVVVCYRQCRQDYIVIFTRTDGITKMIMGDTMATTGLRCQVDEDGKCMTATTGDYVIGVNLDAGVAGDVVRVLLSPSLVPLA